MSRAINSISYTYNSEDEIQEALEWWQDILRLNDWIITIKISPYRSMDKSLGYCKWDVRTKVASIELVDPDHVKDNDDLGQPYDMEHTLVHELLHLYFAPFSPKRDTLEYDMMEQAIDCIAHALVRSYREASDN